MRRKRAVSNKINKGLKSNGITGDLLGLDQCVSARENDEIDACEVGVKSTLLEGTAKNNGGSAEASATNEYRIGPSCLVHHAVTCDVIRPDDEILSCDSYINCKAESSLSASGKIN